jgi:chemotaxis methyl-accepting protein methylase
VRGSLAGIAALVRQETGIALPAAREAALRAAMERAAPGLDSDAFLRAASDAGGDRALLDRLIDEVTVQETTFLRHRRQLDAVAWPGHLRDARAGGSDTIRVWSAGCASGEEAYTLALLAAEALAPAPATVDVLGTDVSGAALAAAAAGRYRERAVRGLEPSLRARYLERQPDGSYLVRERLRRLVRFRRHNLAGDPIPPHGEAAFDVVVCRNVLIYFEAPLARRVIGQLGRSLRPGGVLLLGAVDGLQRMPGPSARPVEPAPPVAVARSRAETWPRAALLASNSRDADAHYVQGLVALANGEPARAVTAFRRALCTDATFTLAAFALGRGYDALGDRPAARRAYEQALRTLDLEDHRHQAMLQQVDIGDIAAACRARLAAHP